jgi:hypothetical protein
MSSSACPCITVFFHTLSHIHHNFREKVNKRKYVFCFSLQSMCETFFIPRRNDGDVIKNVNWSLRKVPPYSCQVLMKLEYSQQIFKKYSHIKFHENTSNRSRVVPCGRTDMKLLAILRTRLKISAANTRITHSVLYSSIPRWSYESVSSAHTSLSFTVVCTLYNVVIVTTSCYYISLHALLLSMFTMTL